MTSLDSHNPGALMSKIPEAAVPPDDTSGLQPIAPSNGSNPSELPLSPNPWEEQTSNKSDVESATKTMPLPDLPVLDHQSFDEDVPPKDDVLRVEILNEFDPLVSIEEKAARDAWADSEGHSPPHPRTPSPPLLPMKDLYISSPVSPEAEGPSHTASPGPSATAITSPTPFASIASFAKNFALPIVKPKPQPFDESAKVAAPPPTSSAPVNEQDFVKSEAPNTRRSSASRSSTPNRGGDDTASSSTKPSDATFDFQIFLDQMKTRSAEPVSRYLRSFLSNFAKRTFTVNDQVKIIGDFLTFIASQMRECDVWRNCSDADFDNAMEGMEKLVMNRLYDFTFTPQLAHANPPRPITTDDLERDRVLSQRIALFSWLEEKHLDVPEGEGSKGFLMFAQQELVKINHYKAPRDKLICILNCCKVIFGLLRHLNNEENADSFLPILIFVVLKANPEHLLSNVEFINRFRNSIKLQSEAGYYLSSLMGAVSFIETMDHASLSCITHEEFEKNVEKAIQNLPPSEPHSPSAPFADTRVRNMSDFASPHAGEESARLLAISTPSISEDAKRLLQKTGDTISKPLNAIGRIFTEALDGAENKLSYLPGPFAPFELGRDSRQDLTESGSTGTRSQRPPPLQWHPDRDQLTPHTPYNYDGPTSTPIQTPYKQRIRKTASPSYSPGSAGYSPGYSPYDTPSRPGPHTNQPLSIGPSQQIHPGMQNSLLPPRVQRLVASEEAHISRTPTPALDIAGVQAQIDLAHEQASSAAKETLRQIFPAVDVEVIDWVLEANEGDLGKSIEQLLEIGGSGN